MTHDTISRLFDHLEWGNALVFDALSSELRPDPESLRLLAHILAAEELWLARIHGRAPRFPVWPSLTLDECARLASNSRAAFLDLLGSLDADALQRVVRYTNSAGYTFENSVGDILVHVALHGHYHRGQIARQLRTMGLTPPYTDFIGFARREQEGGASDAGRVNRAASAPDARAR